MGGKVTPFQVPRNIVEQATQGSLPFGISDQHGYVPNVNGHVASVLSLCAGLPERYIWDVIQVDHFSKLARSAQLPNQKFGLFWLDQRNQASAYCVLVLWRSEALITSTIRGLAAGELLGPAITVRSLLELASHAVITLRHVISVFKPIARENKVIAADNEVSKELEKKLLKAIWGTRIGSSNLGDTRKTLLWDENPYIGETIQAGNPVGDLQKVAQLAPDIGRDAFKVYEFLCDVVHPSTQGFRVFWVPNEDVEQGRTRYFLGKGPKEFDSVVSALTLWALGYSCLTLHNVIVATTEVLTDLDERLHKTYGMPAQRETP